MQRVGSETAETASRATAAPRRANYQGAGRRLAAGGLAAQIRPPAAHSAALPAAPATAASPMAARPAGPQVSAHQAPAPDAPEWDPILPHAWARSRTVTFISGLLCDPPKPKIAESLARARHAQLPQAVIIGGATAIVCTLLLYWGKSNAALLDLDIGRLMQSTQSAQLRTAQLRTEWTLLNSPDRLNQLSDHYLALQPIAPSQYAEQAHLHDRLPPLASEPTRDPATDAAPDQEAVPAEPLGIMAATVAALPEAEQSPVSNTVEASLPATLAAPAAPTVVALPLAPPAPLLVAEAASAAPDEAASSPAPVRQARLTGPPVVAQPSTPTFLTPQPHLRTLSSILAAMAPARTRAAPTRLAAAATPPDRQATYRRVVWSAPVVFANPGILRVSARIAPQAATTHTPPPARLAALARPQLPRWLTEQHDTLRTPITMSEKPHFLDVPQTRAPEPAAQNRPAPEPKIASVSIDEKPDSMDQPQQPALPPLRRVRRYAYPPPSYARYPYPYAYQNGGYYGGQPYYPPQNPGAGYYPYTY